MERGIGMNANAITRSPKLQGAVLLGWLDGSLCNFISCIGLATTRLGYDPSRSVLPATRTRESFSGSLTDNHRGSAITRSDAFAVDVAKLSFNPLSSAGRNTRMCSAGHATRMSLWPGTLPSFIKGLKL